MYHSNFPRISYRISMIEYRGWIIQSGFVSVPYEQEELKKLLCLWKMSISIVVFYLINLTTQTYEQSTYLLEKEKW